MLLLRILLVLSLTTLVVSGALYVFTKDRRYLRFIWMTLKYFVILLLGVVAFLALERFALVL